MRRILTMVALAAAVFITAASAPAAAQNNTSLAPAPSEPVILKPKMKLADIKAVAQFIQGVELRGTEVDAYLDTRKGLMDAAEASEKAGKKDEDVVTFDMRLDQAQNLFTLMQRGSLKGAEAEKWKEIVEVLRSAVKDAQDKMKK